MSSFEAAVEAYQQGEYAQSEKLCRSLLAIQPHHGHALHLVAVLLLKMEAFDEALAHVDQAIFQIPGTLNFLNTRGSILKSAGRLDEAMATYESILGMTPDHVDTMFNMANLLQQRGDLAGAELSLLKVLDVDSDYHPARLNLGFIYKGQGRLDAAEACFRALFNMGGGSSQALHGLGQTLFDRGEYKACEPCFQQLLEANPEDGDAWFFLGNAMHAMGQISQAEMCHRRALELLPEFCHGWNNLGNDLRDQGRPQEAVASYREATRINPSYMQADSNLLLTLNNLLLDGRQLLEEHRRWDQQHAKALLQNQMFKHDRSSARKLYIGYVSSDFCHHSVAFFIEGILNSHDRNSFHVTAYSNLLKPDERTAVIRKSVDSWREIGQLSDDETAHLIREDGIDILIDLSGHTSHHRLLVFARKPAPIQVSYLGYPATTGMQAMDYRITDAVADPACTDAFHSEIPVRLSRCFIAFSPYKSSPAVSALPSDAAGFIRFVSFNHVAKIGPDVIRLWSEVLQAAPNSRLMLKHFSFKGESVRERYLKLFMDHGIAQERIEIYTWADSCEDHLRYYQAADIALDSFPYNGTTTTCESLWMGVPLITLAGRLHAGRVGATLLESVGLGDLAAVNEDAYVEIATALANDRQRLRHLRAGLRERMQHSRLCDVEDMARALENEYRRMWRRWCDDK